MQLSKFERLSLALQLSILEKVDPRGASDHAFNRKALEQGYELEYGNVFEHLHDDLPEEKCNFVIQALDMYRHLNFAQTRVGTQAKIDATMTRFPGFDGNNEAHLLMYVNYLLADANKWTELHRKDHDYNSHAPMAATYEDMLAAWEQSSDKYELTDADLKRVLKAGGVI